MADEAAVKIRLSVERAKQLQTDLKRGMVWIESMWVEAIDGEIWRSLNYGTFTEWWDGEEMGGYHLAPVVRKWAIARMYDETDMTQAELAAEFGVSQKTVSNDLSSNITAEGQLTKEQMAKLSLKQLQKIYTAKKKQAKAAKIAAKQEETAVQAAQLPDLPANVRIETIDFRDMSIEPGSVDVIVTDPPYPAEYLPLYSDLSSVAAQVLKPGGMCVVMSGETYLPEVLFRLTEHLTYRWTMAYLTPGGSIHIWPRKVDTSWKPVIVLCNGVIPQDIMPIGNDVCTSDAVDQSYHHWGQSESGMDSILQRTTTPGQTIFDPFMGAGTTGVAAIRRGCNFIGCDIDQSAVNSANVRITKELENCNASH